MATSQSVLPIDLERRIFEICAHSQPKLIPRLMLVAWRFKEWLGPLLYRTMTVENDASVMSAKELPRVTVPLMLALVQSNAAPLLRDGVRNLYLRAVPPDSMLFILSACTGVENLWILDIRVDEILLIASLPLKHFYGPLRRLLKSLHPTHRIFSQMTHIELLGLAGLDDMEIGTTLGLLPQLTHFSFNDVEFIPVCLRFLGTCKSLAVLISLNAAIRTSLKPYAEAIAVHDVRFVTMNCPPFLMDWQRGAHMGRDYWSRAERFISLRRSGEIDALQYEIPAEERN